MVRSCYKYDFSTGNNSLGLERSYWIDGKQLSRSFCQVLPPPLRTCSM